MQLRADPVCADRVDRIRFRFLIVAIAPDHVDVELRDDVIERYRRVIRIISGTVEAVLLARMPNEDLRALLFRAAREGTRKSDQRGGSGTIVVGAVVDSIRLSVGQDSLRITDMVIVGTESDVRVFELGIGSFDAADDVARVSRI